MTVASEITKAQTNLANSYTACQNKGATLPTAQNFDNLPATIDTITGGGSTGKYQLLDRVKTDSNVEIGTVCGFFTDANDVEYAIVCLDAAYRTVSATYCSNVGLTTNMPIYNNMATSNVYDAKETATQNCDLILAYCTSKGYTSAAVNACRQWIFMVDGVSYDGQLPNLWEVVEILKQYNNIQAKDPTSSSNTSKNFATARGLSTSTQRNQDYYWRSESTGNLSPIYKTTASFVCPILEIPNN